MKRIASSLKKITASAVLICSTAMYASSSYADMDWFEKFKNTASDKDLYTFLYAMPKGGDLHNHISGAARSEWWYDLALDQSKNGYHYSTKTTINNCVPYGSNEFAGSPYLLLFKTVTERTYKTMSECEQSEYKRLEDLNSEEKAAFLNAIRLNGKGEGRDEFFQTHWQRLYELTDNPYLMLEILVKNMQAFGAEGLIYMEPMMGSLGYQLADGTEVSDEDFVAMIKARLKQPDAKATGVTVRLQESILRFVPSAEQQLIRDYKFVSAHSDLYLAVNMVGREDNDKGHPMRFLQTLRELRRTYTNVKLSIHAGEVDEPNSHIRDTLLLGADRIGHGINLITDDELMREMRHGPYMVEINLISNLLLEYVDEYSQHPFPEYLRIGIPVALSTDDRGMWDSNMTDEFFVAVKEFNLSWEEIKTLSLNSLKYSFVDDKTKASLIKTYEERIKHFEDTAASGKLKKANVTPVSYQFLCNYYSVCLVQE